MRSTKPILLVLSALALWGCKGKGADPRGAGTPEVKTLRYLGSFSGVTLPELAEDLGYLAPVKLEWKGNVLGGPEDIRALSTGDVDFASAATGSVIKLLSAGAPIVQVITSGGVDSATWGGFYVLEDSPIHSARDLIGKKIGVNTLGAHSEFMAREWLVRGGLTPEEIKQVTLVVIPPINSEQTLRQGGTEVATLGSILRDKALERGGLRLLFTDRDLFGDFNSATYAVRRKFAKENPVATGKFVEGVARAIEWENTHPREEVQARLRSILSRRQRKEDTTLVKYWKSSGIHSRGGKISDHDIQIWIDWLVKQGDIKPGQIGKLSSLYTNEFNPYRDSASSLQR